MAVFQLSAVQPSVRSAWWRSALRSWRTVNPRKRLSQAQKAELRAVLLERASRYACPIVADVDIGHTAPPLTLPIGCLAEIDGAERRLVVLEDAVGG